MDLVKNTGIQQLKKYFEWADVIIFALVAVYFINLYLFQNYKIPTGSLENLIDRRSFAQQIGMVANPNTPFSFPQHTFLHKCQIVLGKPQWKSRRLAGLVRSSVRYCGI
jgi:signal peptidase I